MNFKRRLRKAGNSRLASGKAFADLFFTFPNFIKWKLSRKPGNILLKIPIFSIIYLAAKMFREEFGSPEDGVFRRAGIVEAIS
jgi:hypothetical protein